MKTSPKLVTWVKKWDQSSRELEDEYCFMVSSLVLWWECFTKNIQNKYWLYIYKDTLTKELADALALGKTSSLAAMLWNLSLIQKNLAQICVSMISQDNNNSHTTNGKELLSSAKSHRDVFFPAPSRFFPRKMMVCVACFSHSKAWWDLCQI